MKKTIFGKVLLVALFSLIVLTHLGVSCLERITDESFDIALAGYTDSYEKPAFSFQTFLSGEYQAQYELWLKNEGLRLRGAEIKLLNQLRYSVFHLPNQNVGLVIGKQGSLFETSYVAEDLSLGECDMTVPENQEKVICFMNQLERVNDKLISRGKYMLVWVTPGKKEEKKENYPLSVRLQSNPDSVGISEFFCGLLRQSDVPCLISMDYLENAEFPLFYSTGVHWSRPAEQIISRVIVDRLSEMSGMHFCTLQLGELESSTTPYWRDADVYNLLNIFSLPKEQEYYCFQEKPTVPYEDTEYDRLSILVQGGSYADGFLYQDHFRAFPDDFFCNISYNTAYSDSEGNKRTSITNLTDIDIEGILDSVDFVIIEVNEAAIVRQSSGFVQYLDQSLDDSSTVQLEKRAFVYSAAQDETYHAAGLYLPEDGFVWTTDRFSVTLPQTAMIEGGISVHFFAPEVCFDDTSYTVEYWVNRKFILSETIPTPGDHTVFLPCSEATDRTYTVEVHLNKTFVPSQIGNSTDDRELGVMLYSVG